jgi:CRISPR-associated RAMP protein (TIGR02581 family)
MFRKLYNQAVLKGELVPDGPVLVVQGGVILDPVAAQLSFVRTERDGEPTVYLPGSSLKGVLRAHGERLLRTLVHDEAAEDPFFFTAPQRSNAREERKGGDTAAVYHRSCEADRLFGSTEIAGRFRIGDAYPPRRSEDAEGFRSTNATEIRYGVAIDRAKQSARGGALFDQEVVTGGRFPFQATLENFELWMLGLILHCFRDLDDGLIQVGHAKSRGLGTMRVENPRLELRWSGARPDRLEGAGAREPDADTRQRYGLHEGDAAPLPAGAQPVPGLTPGYRFTGWDTLAAVLDAITAGPWEGFLAAAQSRQREQLHGV